MMSEQKIILLGQLDGALREIGVLVDRAELLCAQAGLHQMESELFRMETIFTGMHIAVKQGIKVHVDTNESAPQ